MRRLLLIIFLIFSIINIKLLADDKLAKNNDLFKNSNNFSLNQIIDKLNTINDTNKVNSYFDLLESQILFQNDLTFSAKLEFARGYMNYLYSNNLQALKHFAASYKLFNSLKDTNGIVYSLYYQSIIANNINLNSIILNNFIEAKKYIPGFKNDSLLIEFYRLLGSAYFKMNLFNESIDAVQSAIELSYRINSNEQLLRCYMNLALNFIQINKYKEAEDLLTDVLEKSKKLNNDNLISIAYSYLGYLYNTLGQYEKCIEYNLKAIEYRKKAKDKSGLVADLNNIADSYYKLGRYAKALEYAEEAIRYADSLNNLDSKIATNLIIAETYAQLGNYKNAYETLQKSYDAYKDKYNQMFIQEAIDILVKSNYDYLINENMSLKQNIELNNKLLKNNKQLQFFLIISLLFALVIALLLYRNTKINRKYVREMAEMNAELININEKLKENEKELQIANQTKDKFLSIIAHDIRNPIASLMSFINIMRRDFDDMPAKERKELIDELEKVVTNTNQLLDNLLLWVRSQSGRIDVKIVDVNLKDILSQMQALFSSLASQKSIKLVFEGQDELIFKTDIDMLNTILRNLISNAIKFTPLNGMVTIKSLIENNKLIISVSDTGIGMSDDIKQKIFKIGEKVVQYGTNQERGSGLGLLLVKEFVTLLNGTIDFESEKGKGTTFTVTLPLN